MKIYEKPKLMVLSISANDMLCSGCEHPTKGDDILAMFDADENGYLDDGDFGKVGGMFTEDSESCTNKYTGYCKHTGSAIIFTS